MIRCQSSIVLECWDCCSVRGRCQCGLRRWTLLGDVHFSWLYWRQIGTGCFTFVLEERVIVCVWERRLCFSKVSVLAGPRLFFVHYSHSWWLQLNVAFGRFMVNLSPATWVCFIGGDCLSLSIVREMRERRLSTVGRWFDVNLGDADRAHRKIEVILRFLIRRLQNDILDGVSRHCWLGNIRICLAMIVHDLLTIAESATWHEHFLVFFYFLLVLVLLISCFIILLRTIR